MLGTKAGMEVDHGPSALEQLNNFDLHDLSSYFNVDVPMLCEGAVPKGGGVRTAEAGESKANLPFPKPQARRGKEGC